MNMKFTVGEIAKMNGISKQTLIYYDNIDLFKPNLVDKDNGYRYYTSDQLEVLDSILILRELGISIKDIKIFLVKRNDDKALTLLKSQKLKLNNQLKNLQQTIKRLENKISIIENLNLNENEVLFSEMDTEYLVIKKVDFPFQLLETDIALKKLLKIAHEKKFPYNYQLGTIIPKENLLSKKYTSASHVFLPLYKSYKDSNIIEKNKGTYAITLHKGDYLEVGKTYDNLINNININGYEIAGPSFEYCVLDSLTSYSTKDYITKIIIPVKPIQC